MKLISHVPGAAALSSSENRRWLLLSLQQGHLPLAHAQCPKPDRQKCIPIPLLSISKLENPNPEPRLLQRERAASDRTPAVRFAPVLAPIGCPTAQPALPAGDTGMERKGCHGIISISTLRHGCRERGKEANDIHAHQKAHKTTTRIKFHYDS